MRIRKLSALLLSLAMLLGLLSGCGGGDEAEITAEDFYGCWEYADYDMWVCFYDDGTFEWYSDGLDSTGTYSMDGVELHLDDDSERFFVTDGEGGLMDWDGDALFASELPDTWDDEEGLGAPDYEPEVNAEDFYGVWEYANQDVWLYIQGDGSYEWISEYSSFGAGYYMDGVELYLDGLGLTVSLDGEGNLIDSDGEVLFLSELPDFYYNYGWDDEEDDDWDDGDYGSTVSSDDFVGCWEYTDTYTWVYIYGDGTYEWYDSEGLEVMGNYYMFGDELCLEDSGMSFTLDGSGGLVDAFGDTLCQAFWAANKIPCTLSYSQKPCHFLRFSCGLLFSASQVMRVSFVINSWFSTSSTRKEYLAPS